MMNLTIPEVRARLRELAVELDCPELNELADATVRRFNGRRAPTKSRELTRPLAEAIRAYAKAHPSAAQAEIGRVFNVNAGRVSEALFGKRG